MRNGSPPGTLGIGLVNDEVLPPFEKHLLLASHSPHKLSGPSGGRAQGHTVVSQAVQAVPNGYAAAGRTIHCAQRARLKQPVDTLIRSFPPPFSDLICEPEFSLIHLPTSAVKYPPCFNILAHDWHSTHSTLFQQE